MWQYYRINKKYFLWDLKFQILKKQKNAWQKPDNKLKPKITLELFFHKTQLLFSSRLP